MFRPLSLPGVVKKESGLNPWLSSASSEVPRCCSACKQRHGQKNCGGNCKRTSQDIELMTTACKNRLA